VPVRCIGADAHATSVNGMSAIQALSKIVPRFDINFHFPRGLVIFAALQIGFDRPTARAYHPNRTFQPQRSRHIGGQ
jgi:hypothetical protein